MNGDHPGLDPDNPETWIDPPPGTDEASEKQRRKGNGTGRAPASSPHDIDTSILRLNRRPPPFPLAILGADWMGWIQRAAQAASCPVDYIAAPLPATASALIGNVRWPQAWPGWEEPPHLWLASVGDSGDGKTPGENTVFAKIAPELDRRMIGDFPQRHADWKAATDIAAAREADDAWYGGWLRFSRLPKLRSRS